MTQPSLCTRRVSPCRHPTAYLHLLLSNTEILRLLTLPMQISKKPNSTPLHTLTLFYKLTLSLIRPETVPEPHHACFLVLFTVMLAHDFADCYCCFFGVVEWN